MGGLSGRLTMIDQGWERRLDFIEGRVVFVSSMAPTERLATWLARERLAPPARLRHLLGISLLRRALFTDLLMGETGITADDVRSSLNRLAELVTARVLRAAGARFTFNPGYPVRDFLGLNLDLEPHHLVLEAARRSDEEGADLSLAEDGALPFSGDAFERFFWDLIRDGIPDGEPVDGERLTGLHRIVRDIMATLGQWLASSPGLVPVPISQATAITKRIIDQDCPPLSGFPHSVWNQMVLACSVRSTKVVHPVTLSELEREACGLDLWVEMTGSDRWRRPHAGRLDDLTRTVVITWARAAEAAAAHLGVDPDELALAVHLLAVPTDLVLWVLSNLPVPHNQMRITLLRELPRRLSIGLAQLADLPDGFRTLVSNRSVTPLGVCVDLARRALPSASVWPATAPVDAAEHLEVAAPAEIQAAAAAARACVGDALEAPVSGE